MTEHSDGSPTVSVVLPTYNRVSTLSDAIESVLGQTYEDFELIVVDDGSTDRTPAMIESFDDDRLRSVTFPQNRGANVARNAGIRASSGEYVAFQDSDDVWKPQKLERQADAMRNADADVGVVYTGYMKIWPDRREYGPDPVGDSLEGDVHESLLAGNGWFVPTAAALVRRTSLADVGPFDGRLPRLQDWELWLRVSKRYRFELVDEPLVEKSMEPDDVSINTDREALIEALELVLEKHERAFRRRPQYLAKHRFQLGRAHLENGNPLRGRRYLASAFAAKPVSVYAAAAAVGMFGSRTLERVHGWYLGRGGESA